MHGKSTQARFGSGNAVRRVEDEALLKGDGYFADDAASSDDARAYFVRSPYPHAKIVRIDKSVAATMPGIVAIVTGDDLVSAGIKPLAPSTDFKRSDGSPTATAPRYPLAVDTVRYAGEAVAAIVASSLDLAREAAEALVIDYESLPAVVDVNAALAPAAPLLFANAFDNVACEARHGNIASTRAAFAKAAHVVALDLVNQRLAPCPIEPRATRATYDATSDRITLRVSCQTPTGLRDECADVLGISNEKIRVLVGDVGGGFGMKTGLYPEDAVIAFCARKLRSSVHWCAERMEEFVAATHGRDLESRAELALDASGRVLALRVASLANVGAYATPAGVVIQLLVGPWVSTSIYDIDTIDVHIKAVLTHTAPTGAYRGAGRPEAIYIIERLMDEAARVISIDPCELRRRNMIRPEQMPYRTPMEKTYDSGKFESVMNQAIALADWNGFAAREAESKARGRLRGRGMAAFLEWTGADIFTERVTVVIRAADGNSGTQEDAIEIFSATQAMGQGLATTFAQLAVDVFGVPIDKIRILQGDTDRGTGFGSAGSRSLFVGGSAVRVASQRAIDKAQELAARELEASTTDIEYRDGVFNIGGTDRAIGLFDVVRKQPGAELLIDSISSVADSTWPNACHIAEVEIDPDTGETEIVGYWSVNDVGRVVNPMIVVGQLEGGAVQGIGQALCERIIYDREGQLLTASFLDYALPRARMIRHFETLMDESTPCLNNELGVKGVGELGTIGATPAIVNAVADALARNGAAANASRLQMPLTSERVWRALSAKPAN